MRDVDIRINIKESILKKYYTDCDSRVVEEMLLPVAKARIDMAVINGHLHGFEIKSASDTLQRLPAQVLAYSKVFDYLSIITEEKYYKKIIEIIPDWVGVFVCCKIEGKNNIRQVQKNKINKNQIGFFIAKLLWREELIQVLSEQNIQFQKKDRNWILAETLSSNMSMAELSKVVRKSLKQRQSWKLELN